MKYWIISKKDENSQRYVKKLHKEIELDLDEKAPDIVIAIGGDGTFISAVHQYPKAIHFGLHTGHLGFYANYTLADIDTLIDDINHSSFVCEKIDSLKCELKTSHTSFVTYAINEMTILMPPKTLILDVKVDGELLETFRGTGVCLSTAYGSTAYNKSLDGAIVDSTIHSIQLAEIAGINSNQFRTLSTSLVLSSKRVVSLHTKEEEHVFVTIDNQSYDLKDFMQADISLLESQIKIGCHTKRSFIQRIKKAFFQE